MSRVGRLARPTGSPRGSSGFPKEEIVAQDPDIPELVAGRKPSAGDRERMEGGGSVEGVDAAGDSGAPQLQGPVGRRGEDVRAVGSVEARGDPVGVAPEATELLPGLGVPFPDGPVSRSGEDAG